MADKATIVEKHQRIQLVEEMLLKGCNTSYILRFFAEKYNISERTIEYYLAEAKQKIKTDFENTFDKKAFKSEIYGRYQDLYRKNYTIQDFRECRNIIKDLKEMLGLDEENQNDVPIFQNIINLGSGIMPDETSE